MGSGEVRGGQIHASVTDAPIDESAIETLLMTDGDGALVTFRGVVRNHDRGLAVRSLEYSAHPDAERFLRECCETISRDTGLSVAATHRTGPLAIGDVALFAAVAAPHRGEAFAACQALVDLIKLRVPIWKRQHLADGATEWVGL
jgi:molybdopterin synthase catalytic subunit